MKFDIFPMLVWLLIFVVIGLVIVTIINIFTDSNLASFTSYGSGQTITCYSGGKIFYESESSGRITEMTNGWSFKDKSSGKFVRVSGDCVVRGE